jgi:hypothetical protein
VPSGVADGFDAIIAPNMALVNIDCILDNELSNENAGVTYVTLAWLLIVIVKENKEPTDGIDDKEKKSLVVSDLTSAPEKYTLLSMLALALWPISVGRLKNELVDTIELPPLTPAFNVTELPVKSLGLIS